MLLIRIYDFEVAEKEKSRPEGEYLRSKRNSGEEDARLGSSGGWKFR